MNDQVNTGNTHSSTDSRIKTTNVETRWKNIHWSSKKWQFFLEGYSGHQTSIIGIDV